MKKILFGFLILTIGVAFSFSKVSTSFASTVFQENLSGAPGQNWTPSSFTLQSGDDAVYNASGVIGVSGGADYTYATTTLDNIIQWTMDLNGNSSALISCRDNNDYSSEERVIFTGDGFASLQWFNNGNGSSATAASVGNSGTHNFELDCSGQTMTLKEDGTTVSTATTNWDNTQTMTQIRLGFLDTITTLTAYQYCDANGCGATPTPTPTPVPNTINVSPSSSTVTVGTPFNVTVAVAGGTAFNAAQAHIAVSTNLSITGIHSAPSPACNLQYTQTPTTTDPSFAGAIYGSSSTNCNVYTLTLTPNAAGTGTITVTNGSIKSYADNSEVLTSVTNGSYTINAANATPTPTPALSGLTITSPTETYNSTYTLSGTKDTNTTTVFVNGSSTGVTYPTSTTWQVTETLTLGANNTAGSDAFTVYGTDGNGNQTATINTTVSLHELGDINGDGSVDLTDASLFAVDWGKTGNLTYLLSDMNSDGNVDLTDLSILAKLEAQ